jgi:fermentation-respiration switch protein FrsA (DUF1100 family)
MTSTIRIAVAVVAAAFALPGSALAATSVGRLFPTNLDTVPDATQVTGVHVQLPQPNCTTNPSDCADVAELNELDGFNIQPRLTIPFTGPIDLSTVSSSTIFLVAPDGGRTGINQLVWAPATNTLYAESDEQLAQHTTYLLVVTRGVHDADGTPLGGSPFLRDTNFGQTKDPAAKAYRKALIDALALAGPADVAGASLFTTQSITALGETIRAQLQGSAVNFNLGTQGQRTVFSAATTPLITVSHQTATSTFVPSPLPVFAPSSPLFTGIGTVAFGTYDSPSYETAQAVIPAYATKTGVPVVQSVNHVQFTLWEPAGTPPAGGWPTVIFGHGFTDSKDGAPVIVASAFAQAHLATIAVNVVGHGGFPGGFYTATTTSGTVTFPDGGRGIDQNGNGVYDGSNTEGASAVGAANELVATRDSLRQTTIDLMQLVKVLQHGAIPGLSTSRIYYAGQSFGGIYGGQLLGLDPDIRAGVLNVPGGSIPEIARLSPSFRGLVGFTLLTHSPSLFNAIPNASLTNFNENMPLRNLPAVTATPDQVAIQRFLDWSIWEQQTGNPAAYAPDITRPLIIQFARGDKTVPNPTTSAILRAGNLASRATLFRNDLARANISGYTVTNPHTFLTNVFDPAALPCAIDAQVQMATFLATDGQLTIHPVGNCPYFETPTSMVPEDLAYLP